MSIGNDMLFDMINTAVTLFILCFLFGGLFSARINGMHASLALHGL